MKKILRLSVGSATGNSRCLSLVLPLVIIVAISVTASSLTAQILSVSPDQNAINVNGSTDITVVFDTDMDPATIGPNSFVVVSFLSGMIDGAIAYDAPARTAIFDPDIEFMTGDNITVTLTGNIETASGAPLDNGFVWTFTIRADGSGGGYFHLDDIYDAGTYTRFVRVAELNGDGNLDLMVHNDNYIGARPFFGNGDGGFLVGTGLEWDPLRDLRLADLDADGDMDLAAVSFYWKAAVFYNNGDGSFAAPVDIGEVSEPRQLYINDFDGDGDNDIAVTDYNSYAVIFHNQGSGLFAPVDTISFSYEPQGITGGDFDRDGSIDLALSANEAGPDSLFVFMNNGDGTFGAISGYEGADSSSVPVPGDYDGDGDLDLALSSYAGQIYIYVNYGNGVFATPERYALSDNPVTLFANDFDADADLDLATNNIRIMLNDGGAFSPGPMFVYPFDPDPFHVAGGDLDNDGDIDLVTTLFKYDKNVAVLLNLACPDDTDGDGFGDPGYPGNQCPEDNCPLVYNPDQADSDLDGNGDSCDICPFDPEDDSDNDGICADIDNCPDIPNVDQLDADDDGVGDICDNCPDDFNPDQYDGNQNGVGDACEFEYSNGVYTDICPAIYPGSPAETLFVGSKYIIRTFVGNDFVLGGLSLGFRIYTGDGITWSWLAQPEGYPSGGTQAVTVVPGSRLDPPQDVLDMTGLIITEQDMDGVPPDTIMFGGVSMMYGLPAGPIEPLVNFHVKLNNMTSDSGTLCVDSAFVPPSGAFVFIDAFGGFPPTYHGPFCWPVIKRMILGDFDLDGEITVGDPVEMIQYIFYNKPHPYPDEVGDGNGDGDFNVGDIIYMINYIFRHGPPPMEA